MKYFYQNLKRLGLHPEGVREGELNDIKEERNCDKKRTKRPQRSGCWQQFHQSHTGLSQ